MEKFNNADPAKCFQTERMASLQERAAPTWVSELVSHDAEGSNLLLLRGMNHHHCGPQDAQQTTHFSMYVQPLIKEIRGEHGTGKTQMVQTVCKPPIDINDVYDIVICNY